MCIKQGMQKYQSFTFLIAFYCYYLIVDGLIAVQESYVLMFPIWDNYRYKYCELCPLIHNDILYPSYSANLKTHILIIMFNSFRLKKEMLRIVGVSNENAITAIIFLLKN